MTAFILMDVELVVMCFGYNFLLRALYTAEIDISLLDFSSSGPLSASARVTRGGRVRQIHRQLRTVLNLGPAKNAKERWCWNVRVRDQWENSGAENSLIRSAKSMLLPRPAVRLGTNIVSSSIGMLLRTCSCHLNFIGQTGKVKAITN